MAIARLAVNGLLVPSHVDALTSAISRLADPDLRAELSAGALRVRDQRRWERTVEDFAALLR